jgi:hypothetical protein
MTKEEEKNEKAVAENPLIATVFKPPEATIFVHSESRQVLAYIVIGLQRIVGKENLQPLQPYYNDARKSWGIQIFIKRFPKSLLNSHSILPKEVKNEDKEIVRKLEPPEEPPTDKEV